MARLQPLLDLHPPTPRPHTPSFSQPTSSNRFSRHAVEDRSEGMPRYRQRSGHVARRGANVASSRGPSASSRGSLAGPPWRSLLGPVSALAFSRVSVRSASAVSVRCVARQNDEVKRIRCARQGSRGGGCGKDEKKI
eukprot:2034249-Rhodomonas_salina.2